MRLVHCAAESLASKQEYNNHHLAKSSTQIPYCVSPAKTTTTITVVRRYVQIVYTVYCLSTEKSENVPFDLALYFHWALLVLRTVGTLGLSIFHTVKFKVSNAVCVCVCAREGALREMGRKGRVSITFLPRQTDNSANQPSSEYMYVRTLLLAESQCLIWSYYTYRTFGVNFNVRR